MKINKEELLNRRGKLKSDRDELLNYQTHRKETLYYVPAYTTSFCSLKIPYVKLILQHIEEEIEKIDGELGI